MMVSCPGCNNSYSLDERKIPAAGANLTCIECGKKWSVRPPSPGQDTPAAALGRSDDPKPAARAVTPAPPPSHADWTGPLTSAVSCPRCGHSFVPAARGAAAAEPPSPPRPKILLIEDQNYFAELTREALGGLFETIVVSNIARARAAMSQDRFQLVILDLSLEEGQDGSQLLAL